MSKMLSKTPNPFNRFNSLPINEQQRGRMDRIRQLVKRLFLESRHLCPEGRYLDQAHEQLEIVHMLLNKSISHDWEGSSDQIATDDPVLAPSFDVEALCEALDADVLEPDYPIEEVDQDLRDMGVDPDEVGQRGEELVQGLLAEKKSKAKEPRKYRPCEDCNDEGYRTRDGMPCVCSSLALSTTQTKEGGGE